MSEGRFKFEKAKTLNVYRAKKAVRILIEEIDSVRTVKQWSEKINFSTGWLKKMMKAVYNKSPKIILREVRYEIILLLILEYGMETTSLYVAYESGVGKTSDALYKFLHRHYDMTFSELKESIVLGKYEMEFIWLNGSRNNDIDDKMLE